MDFYSGLAVVISSQKSLIRPGAFIGMALSYPGPAGRAVLEPTRQGGSCEHVPQHIGQGWSSGRGPGAADGAGLLHGSTSSSFSGCPKLHKPPANWSQGQPGSWAASAPGKSCFHVLNLLH